MLPYALAIAVGLSSSVLFLIAFFFKEIHRQDDFFWSGIGLFYALVLWFCATSISGALLLGQLAVVALLTAYFWQVIKLRQAIANPQKRDSLDSFSVVDFLKNLFNRSSAKVAPVKEIAEGNKTTIETKNDQRSEQAPSSYKSASPGVSPGVYEGRGGVVSDSPSPVAEQTIASETSDRATEAKIVSDTKAQPTAENSTLKEKESIPEAAAKQDITADVDIAPTQDNQEDSTPQNTPSPTTTKLNEILDAEEPEASPKDTSVATPSPTETTAETSVTEENTSSNTETMEITEMSVETVTVVEEETNWDDEVEDIPASSIKIIKEVPPTPKEQSSSNTTDSPTENQDTNNIEAESKKDNQESSD